MKKYKLKKDRTLEKEGHTLYQIEALHDFYLDYYNSSGRLKVRKGETGGWIESEENLSQEGSCWTYSCMVYGGAKIEGNALVDGNAVVKDGARIGGRARIGTKSIISGKTTITEEVHITNSTIIDLDVIGKRLTGIVDDVTIERLSEGDIIKAIQNMTQEERESLYAKIMQEGLI